MWRWRPASRLWLALLAPACTADSAEESPQSPGPTATGCEVRVGVSGGPITDPNGPYFHQMALARTTDGVTLAGTRLVLDHASVPDGVRRADSTVFAYYVSGADGFVWVARLAGDTAVPLAPLTLNGISPVAGVVDPDAWLTSGGRVRLAYLSGFGPPSSGTVRAMCLAESSDGGLTFSVLGRALAIGAGEPLTDPSVVRLPDGTWRMAVSLGARTVLARSDDGLAFARYDTVAYGGVPELAVTADGRLRLYVCAAGIVSYVSPDGGLNWQPEATVVPPGTLGKRIVCDPSLVAATDLFVFKTGD